MTATKLTKAQLSLLAAVVLATASESGIMFAQAENKDVKALVAANLIEQNPGVTNPDDETEIATSATGAGIELNGSTPSGAVAGGSTGAEAPKEKQSFAIVADVAIPAAKRGGRTGTESYPFAQLLLNGSFFVPKTDSRPEPVKSLASTVATANDRYSKETGEVRINRRNKEVPVKEAQRRFEMRAIADGAPLSAPPGGSAPPRHWHRSASCRPPLHPPAPVPAARTLAQQH